VKRFLVLATLVALVTGLFPLLPVQAAPTELFFSEYVEGTSNNKALEVFNGTGAPINLAAEGYNVQMFFNGNPVATLTINLTGTVAAGDVYVLAQSSAVPAILAQADQTNGAGWFNGDDAVVLRKGTTIVDAIGQAGFDPGTEWGSGLNSTADNTLRRKPSIQGGDSNALDLFDPAAEWDGFAADTFDGLGSHALVGGDENAPTVSSTNPGSGATGVATTANITINFSEPVNVSGSWYSISCATSGAHTAAQSGGPQSFILNPDADFAFGESCNVTVVAAQVSDQDALDPPDNMDSDFSFSFTAEAVVAIHDVQGPGHRSPLAGQVTTEGIVTAKASNGFWVQDPNPDANDATSEGLFVFGTTAAGLVAVGNSVRVRGTVAEFRPGGSGGLTNLTTTELTSPSVTTLSVGNPLPAATVIGIGGRIPPTTVIEDDATGDVETSGVFDPATDGIDFYESLEGMRVQINDAVVVGPRNPFGEIPVLGDGGAGASVRTARGGIVIRTNDFNPERIILDDVLVATPVVKVGDRFSTPVLGVMDYSFGNFKVLVTAALTLVDGGLVREVTRTPTDHEIVVGTYNVENLDPGDGNEAFLRHARLIVNNLHSPDLLAVEEIQDNNGPVGREPFNSTVTDASVTWGMLIAAIQAVGGPVYQYRQIDPEDDKDGGEPGGNIRVGFLLRTDRGLQFIDRPGGDATTPTVVVSTPSGPRLSVSPGRIDPSNPAWSSPEGVRKPLAGEFRARGKKLFVIANHWKSKSGDQPLFGRFQPPMRITETQRNAEARVVRTFVDEILALDPTANVIVLGDLNDFEFSGPLTILKGISAGDLELHPLIETLPPGERYAYVFEGNSQTLDHIVVSNNLFTNFSFEYDVVHVNSEFPDQASDHEPQVVRLDLRGRPTPKTP